MIKSGVKPVKKDIRDYDYHRTFGAAKVVQFADNFTVDAGLIMPDQNADGYPFGCTGYAQIDLCIDEDFILYDPIFTYTHTPPNDKGGRDLRDSLKCLIDLGPQTKEGVPGQKRLAYFNVRPIGSLDWFDSVRLVLYSNKGENRAVSVGTPWFNEFETPLSNGILPIPIWDIAQASWHNWVICGWETIGGAPYLVGKSWQGNSFGDRGFHKVSRRIFNAIMEERGTAAFTVSKIEPAEIETVKLTWFQSAISYIANLFK